MVDDAEGKKVEVHMKDASDAVVHTGVKNTYEKGSLFCVYVDGSVYKYPLANIWRIKEDY